MCSLTEVREREDGLNHLDTILLEVRALALVLSHPHNHRMIAQTIVSCL
jgi:hypothetical protein